VSRVDQLMVPALMSPLSTVALVDQEHLEPAHGGVPGDGRAVDARPDDDHVELDRADVVAVAIFAAD
jgi:hypothetical protein